MKPGYTIGLTMPEVTSSEVLECFSFEQACAEIADLLGVPAHWMKRTRGRNYVLQEQYEK